MTDANEPEVKDVERVEVAPSADSELVESEKPEPESSQAEKPEGEEPEAEVETAPETEPEKPDAPPAIPVIQKIEVDGIKRLPDETDREYALRLELNNTRKKLRQERTEDLLGQPPKPVETKTEPRPESKKILSRYKPEQLTELKEVFSVLAEDMGFVKKGEIETQTFLQKGEEELQNFIAAHPEYQPENDPQGIAWGRFRQEYGLYKPPTNPKDFKKLFEKVHRDIYGIQPKGDLGKVNAQKEKIKVASHSGTSSPTAQNRERPTTRPRTTGLRTDMLQGFKPEEIAEMTGE